MLDLSKMYELLKKGYHLYVVCVSSTWIRDAQYDQKSMNHLKKMMNGRITAQMILLELSLQQTRLTNTHGKPRGVAVIL